MPKETNYAFIDSQNLNLGIKSQGWELDYGKFRIYLKNKYNIQKAYLFIGQVKGNEKLYKHLIRQGYELVYKPTTQYMVDGKVTVKGNVDAELVLYAAAKAYKHYDKAVIVSGDGDFHCLAEFLLEKNKLAYILVPNRRFSGLLHSFDTYIKRIDNARQSLERRTKNKTRTSGRYETLGIPGHGDPKAIIANDGDKRKMDNSKNPRKGKTIQGGSSVRENASASVSGKPVRSKKGQK